MSPRESRDAETVADLIEACGQIIGFTGSAEETAFYRNPETKFATLYQILVLGEAVKRLSSDIRERYPEVPWQDIAGMRDRLTHTYDDINLREVWRTSQYDVPLLLEQLLRIRADLAE